MPFGVKGLCSRYIELPSYAIGSVLSYTSSHQLIPFRVGLVGSDIYLPGYAMEAAPDGRITQGWGSMPPAMFAYLAMLWGWYYPNTTNSCLCDIRGITAYMYLPGDGLAALPSLHQHHHSHHHSWLGLCPSLCSATRLCCGGDAAPIAGPPALPLRC